LVPLVRPQLLAGGQLETPEKPWRKKLSITFIPELVRLEIGFAYDTGSGKTRARRRFGIMSEIVLSRHN
jgi:hypothetical protein